MLADGVPADVVARAIVQVDSKGLVHHGRAELDDDKREFALSADALRAHGLHEPDRHEFASVVRHFKSTALVGTSAQHGAFTSRSCGRWRGTS